MPKCKEKDEICREALEAKGESVKRHNYDENVRPRLRCNTFHGTRSRSKT